VNHVVRYRSILLQRHGATILSKVNDLSRQHSVDVYPTFGTLLGLIRDGRLMKHDFDMDFAILPSATNLSVFFAELQKEGFYFEWMETVDDCLTEVRFRYKELTIDFFLHSFTADRNKMMMIQTDSETRRYEYPRVDFLIDHSVLGLNLRIPNNYEEYLTSMYGAWNIVIKSGWSSTMAPCFIGVNDPSQYSITTSFSSSVFLRWIDTHQHFPRLADKGYAVYSKSNVLCS